MTLDAATVAALEAYRDRRVKPGDMLARFVIQHNAFGLLVRAHAMTLDTVRAIDIYKWCRRNLPEEAWRSMRNYVAWTRGGDDDTR